MHKWRWPLVPAHHRLRARQPRRRGQVQRQEFGLPARGGTSRWTQHVNDQSIVVGWAGDDEGTSFLPPEHFVAHAFRDAIVQACRNGALAGHGPDGKLLVRLREEAGSWWLEHVLVTIQQLASASLLDVSEATPETLREKYEGLQERDGRWRAPWQEVELTLNPNGPLLNGGSDGDNGQTGRKLAVDFYGPRVPIGGGALSGQCGAAPRNAW